MAKEASITIRCHPADKRGAEWLAEKRNRELAAAGEEPNATPSSILLRLLRRELAAQGWSAGVERQAKPPAPAAAPPPERVVELDEAPAKRSAGPGAGSAPPKKKSR